MKTSSFKTLAVATGLASLAAFQGGSALAEGLDFNLALQDKPFASTTTRDQVNTAYLQAAKDGSLPRARNNHAVPMTATAPSSNISRDAVYADTIEWLRVSRGDVQMGSH